MLTNRGTIKIGIYSAMDDICLVLLDIIYFKIFFFIKDKTSFLICIFTIVDDHLCWFIIISCIPYVISLKSILYIGSSTFFSYVPYQRW